MKSRTFCAYAHLVLSVVLEESLDSTAGKLRKTRQHINSTARQLERWRASSSDVRVNLTASACVLFSSRA